MTDVQPAEWQTYNTTVDGHPTVTTPHELSQEQIRSFADDGYVKLRGVIEPRQLECFGPLITEHPDIDKITFTGSTATGKKIMEGASKDLKRITLELGGNDASIVLPDADVSKVAEQLFWSSFSNAGQICVAAKRIYIHEDIYDELSQAIAEYSTANLPTLVVAGAEDELVAAEESAATAAAARGRLVTLPGVGHLQPLEAPQAVTAFQHYIEQGRGGWIGFHHAALLGEFDGYPIWPWFSGFMGGIRWKHYIAGFAAAKVNVEDTLHSVMKGLHASFVIDKDEWYTWDKSPRPNVHVIASVDESTYTPDSPVKMGDHPVIWSNDHYPARNIYIFMGHSPDLFNNKAYTTLFRNAICWAAGRRLQPAN